MSPVSGHGRTSWLAAGLAMLVLPLLGACQGSSGVVGGASDAYNPAPVDSSIVINLENPDGDTQPPVDAATP